MRFEEEIYKVAVLSEGSGELRLTVEIPKYQGRSETKE